MGPEGLWIGVLGPLEVRLDASPAGPGGARRRGLLAILASQPNAVHSVASLIDGLWGEEPPASAVNVVQTYVSAWRKALGGDEAPLSRVGAGYRLTLAPEQCDLLMFRELVGRARSADGTAAVTHWRAALDLWRGPALADLTGEPFHELLTAPWEAERAAAIEQWAELALVNGAPPDDVLADLVDAQVREPLRESTTALVMQAHARAGRPAAALAAYDAVRRRLDEELGTIPGPALRSVHERILRGDPELLPQGGAARRPPGPEREVRSPRRSAPADRFFGRSQELDDSAGLLAAGGLVTLTGPGGSGKTRLAHEVLSRHLETGAPGWFVELAPVQEPALAPSAVASALGLGVAAGTDPADMLIDRLADSHGLLVLDNAEHLIGVADFVRRLHRGCRDLRLLVTSRQALLIEGEQQYAVPVLPVPGSTDLEDVAGQASVELLVDRVRARDPDFAVTRDNVEDVARIVRHLDGLPLAIEIVAPWVQLYGTAALVERLAQGHLDLRGRRRDTAPRHRSLRDTIAWSHALVSERERILFRRLALFPGTFGFAAAAAVAGEDPLSVEEVLLDLVDRNLVQAVAPVSGQARFRMLVVVREFALEQLADAPEQEAARTRMAAWYAAWAAQLAGHSEGPESPDWLALAVAEADNLRAVLDHGATQRTAAERLQLVVDVMALWFEAGHEQEGEARLGEALAEAGPDAPARAIGLTYWAWLRATRDRAGAADAATEARALASSAGDLPVEAFALQTLGDCLADPEEAQAASRGALDACDRAEGLPVRYGPTAPDAVRCGASASIAATWTYRDVRESRAWQAEALRRAEVEGDRRITAVNCARLAHVHLLCGEVPPASELVGRARGLVSSRVSARWEDIVSLADAQLARHEGRTEDAERLLRAIADGAVAAGRVLHALLGGVALADLLLDTGRPEQARVALDRAASVGPVSDPAHLARLDVRRARVERELGRPERARETLDAIAGQLAAVEGMPPERSLWLIEMVALARAEGHDARAQELVDQLESALARTGLVLPPWERARLEG